MASLPFGEDRAPGPQGKFPLVRQKLFWLITVLIPSTMFGILVAHPELDILWEAPWLHLILVGEIGLSGIVFSVLTARVAVRIGNARVVLMALAFYAIGVFLVVHAALTPDSLISFSTTGVEISLVMGFLLCSVFLAASSLKPSDATSRVILRNRRLVFLSLTLLAASVATITLLIPDLFAGATSAAHAEHGYGDVAHWFSLGGSLITIILLGFAIVPHYRDFRLTGLPFHHAMITGLLLLQVAAVTFPLSLVWHVRWWEYHILLLGGMGIILLGLLREVARRNDLLEVFATLLVGDTVSKLENSYTEVLQALIELVEAKDIYVQGHSVRVARMSVAIGEALHLPPEDLRRLYQAALLHDVGKIAVPEAILNKPQKLTKEEFAMVAAHTVIGAQLVSRFPSLSILRPGIRWHHERLDGSGYPDGLVGDAIPLDARIIAVADVFDAMTSARAYRGPLSVEEAIGELTQNVGIKFDPAAVAALSALPEVVGHQASTKLSPPRLPPVRGFWWGDLNDLIPGGAPGKSQKTFAGVQRNRVHLRTPGMVPIEGSSAPPIQGNSLGEGERRQIKKRGILLASVGLSLMLLVMLGLKLLGITAISFSQWAVAAGVTLVVQTLLWLILHLGWDRWIAWDRHYLYIPMGAAAMLLSLYALVSPEFRVISLLAWFAALLFMVGLAGFLEIILLSALMASGYLAASVFTVGEHRSLIFEAVLAVLFLIACSYAGVVFERLRRNREEMKALRRMLGELAITDPLTGLFNRRHFEEILQAEVSRIQRYGGQCTVVLMDLDFFKSYNDTFGHVAGDAVLKDLAALMRQHLRTSDVLARYGGEEFGLIMVNATKEEAYQAMERLRAVIEGYAFPGRETYPFGRLTISAGIASCPEDATEVEELVMKADVALYAAKRQGRNRVQIAHPP